jgi:hypothetical protein
LLCTMADVSIKHLSCCGVTRCHASTQEFKIFLSDQMPWFAVLKVKCCSMELHNLSTIEHMQMSVLCLTHNMQNQALFLPGQWMPEHASHNLPDQISEYTSE